MSPSATNKKNLRTVGILVVVVLAIFVSFIAKKWY